jgi:hypothetical protein
MSSKNNRGPSAVFTQNTIPFVKAALKEAANMSPHKHDRCADRVAVGYRDITSPRDRAFDGFMRHDGIRLFALSLRWCVEPGGEARRRHPLAIYRPVVDLPGSGRIVWQPDAVYDAATMPWHKNGLRGLSPFSNETATRLGVLLHQAIDDADPDKIWSELHLPHFYYVFAADMPPYFEPAYTQEEWDAARVELGGRHAWPSWMFARDPSEVHDVHPITGTPRPDPTGMTPGVRTEDGWILDASGSVIPAAQVPQDVYCDCDHLVGRQVRNPAYAALRACGLIPFDLSFRAFRDQHSRWAGGVRTHFEIDPASDLGRALAGLDQEGRAGLVRAFVGASGVSGWVGSEPEGVSFLNYVGGLLNTPTRPVEDLGASSILVVRLAGPPAPDNMRFALPDQEIDLFDLGRYSDRYQWAPPAVLRMAVKGGQRRDNAWQPRTGSRSPA